MRQLTVSTVCVIAALATAPAPAAAEGKPGTPARATECSHEPSGKAGDKAPASRSAKDREMDCIVVRGYPSQDGRATLRKSLEKEAKESLGKTFQLNLKDLLGKKRTS